MAEQWLSFGRHLVAAVGDFLGGNKQGLLALVVLPLVASSSLAFCDGAFLAKASSLKGKRRAFVCSSFIPAIRSIMPMPIPWLHSFQLQDNYFQKLKQRNKLWQKADSYSYSTSLNA